jgi:uncharacterized protein with HEPN domain
MILSTSIISCYALGKFWIILRRFHNQNSNDLIQDAVIRNIEIIGEASNKISKDLKSSYHEIPWREISGMRDKLIHDYMGVDKGVVWKTIKEDIPFIQSLMQKIER